jgi:hypothetical protein
MRQLRCYMSLSYRLLPLRAQPLAGRLLSVRQPNNPWWLSARTFVGTHARQAGAAYGKASAELEKRIDDIPMERIRNFCIVAHVVSAAVNSPRLGCAVLISRRIMERALVRSLPTPSRILHLLMHLDQYFSQ